MEKSDIKQLLKDIKEYEQLGSFVMGVVVVVLVALGIVYGVVKMKFQERFNRGNQNNTQVSVTPTKAVTLLEQLPQTPDLYEKDGKWYVRGLPAEYEVKAGDSSWKVALAVYGSGDNYRDIEIANNMPMNQDLVVGQMIILPDVQSKKLGPATTLFPAPTATVPVQNTNESTLPAKHVVQPSEGLWQIAQRYYNDGYQYLKIYEANKDKMKGPEDIRVGMELTIPR